jgi:toxin ParE1/3/4
MNCAAGMRLKCLDLNHADLKRVEWSHQARRDTAEGADWYAAEGGLPLAERFLTQVHATLQRVAQFPASGSTRHAGCIEGLHAPLRFVPVARFERYLIYYLDLPTHVEVLRVWNSARGLDALMEDAP